jgi:hypothetical protein
MGETKPPDASNEEFELLNEVEGELERLARHPRAEARRLHSVAEEGESGATPLIEFGFVASRVLPIVALMIGLIVGVYYLAQN